MVNHYRWDFIGLSTDDKPTPATSEKVADGSTFYCSDNSKLYVWYKDQWYEKEATGGGTTYTAGTNISIEGGVISSPNTVTETTLDTRLDGLTLLVVTQAEYDLIDTPDPDTLYIIKAV